MENPGNTDHERAERYIGCLRILLQDMTYMPAIYGRAQCKGCKLGYDTGGERDNLIGTAEGDLLEPELAAELESLRQRFNLRPGMV